jgi:molybdopterin synthase sulfur carrier subunit
MIRMRDFAWLREQLDTDDEAIDADGLADTVALRESLRPRGGPWEQALRPDATVLAAVNDDMARADMPIVDGDEVTFFPPVTGG